MAPIVLTPAQCQAILLVVNVVEQLAVLSGGLVGAARDGEAYESLCRQIEVLHQNIVEVAAQAAAAKVSEAA